MRFFHVTTANFDNFKLGCEVKNSHNFEEHTKGIWFSNSLREALGYKNTKSTPSVKTKQGFIQKQEYLNIDIFGYYYRDIYVLRLENNIIVECMYKCDLEDILTEIVKMESYTQFEYDGNAFLILDENDIIDKDTFEYDNANYLYEVSTDNLNLLVIEGNYDSVIGNFPNKKELEHYMKHYDGLIIKGHNYADAVIKYCSTLRELEIEYAMELQKQKIQRNMVENHCNLFVWNTDKLNIILKRELKLRYG